MVVCGVGILSGANWFLRVLLGRSTILGVLILVSFSREGGVSGEENGQNTDWNVNWSISDVRSHLIPSSHFISPLDYLHF